MTIKQIIQEELEKMARVVTTFTKGDEMEPWQPPKEGWHGLCFDCGKEVYPKPDGEAGVGNGITVSLGDCPRCNKKNVGIIPIRDFDPNYFD